MREEWARLVGLPLHLWCKELFKKLGDSCGGFIAVDEDMTFLCNKQWARVCVRLNGNSRLSSVQIRVGCYCYVVQLWWEFCPWLVQGNFGESSGGCEVRGEVVGGARTGPNVGKGILSDKVVLVLTLFSAGVKL